MKTQRESGRRWALGLAVIVTGMVTMIGFWHLAPGLTFLVAVGALILMLVFLWAAGDH